MNTIKENIEKTIVIKKSKFISKAYFINSISEVKDIIKKNKDKYNDASHICYAYIIDNEIKYSDDKEPNNTAGLPIYNVLEKNDLNHVLIVVIRYFGGIKLGTGGLTRAYSNSTLEVINNNTTQLIKAYQVEIKLDYDYIKDVLYILNNNKIINKSYEEDISISFYTSDLDNIKSKLEKYIKEFTVLKTTYIPLKK